ncbi:hypothetical protein HDU80_004505 [Chytriomyces hyalinus]|nr:hypothetical protein HDU80_004505 [Chytriomyces hyalinus]
MLVNAALVFLVSLAVSVDAANNNDGSVIFAKDKTSIFTLGKTSYLCNSNNVRVDKDKQKFVLPSNITTKTCGRETNTTEKGFLDLTSKCPSAKSMSNFKNYHLFDPSKVCPTKCRLSSDGKKCTPDTSKSPKSALKAKRQLLKRQDDDISKGSCEVMSDGSYLCDYNKIDNWYLEKSPISLNDFYFVADDEDDTQTGQWEYYFFDTASYKAITNSTTLAGAKQSKDCWCGNTIMDAPGDPLTSATQCGFKFPCFTDLGCDLYCKPDYDGKTTLMVNFRRQTKNFTALPGEDSYYWYWAEAKDDELEAYDPEEFEKDAQVTGTAAVKATTAAQTSKSSAFVTAVSFAALLLSYFSI